VVIDVSETTLATLAPGDFFGEISLLDRGMRSADVIADLDSAVLKLSAQSFERIVQETPHLASPLLLALSKSIISRVRNLSKRYEDSVHFSHLASSVDH
jgi:CRP-like cAMP-binding protein